jgi:hypothetical protein
VTQITLEIPSTRLLASVLLGIVSTRQAGRPTEAVMAEQNYGEQLVDQGLAVLSGARHIAVSAVETAFDTAHKVISAQRDFVSDLFGSSEKPAA